MSALKCILHCSACELYVRKCMFHFSLLLLPHPVRCKASLSLIGLQCDFCLRRFCLTHHQAEVHGCGEEAKRMAHRQSQKEWREALSSPSSSSFSSSEKSREVRRKQLHQKLKGQIGELEGKRTKSAQAKK